MGVAIATSSAAQHLLAFLVTHVRTQHQHRQAIEIPGPLVCGGLLFQQSHVDNCKAMSCSFPVLQRLQTVCMLQRTPLLGKNLPASA